MFLIGHVVDPADRRETIAKMLTESREEEEEEEEEERLEQERLKAEVDQ
jgi:hypothetical protein